MTDAAEIAARYGATVAPGVTVQRLPTGASARPYPVWDEQKGALVVPDWQEQREQLKRAGMRRSRAAAKRGAALDAQLIARMVEMQAQGMRPASIAEAVGLKVDQVYRALRAAGHPFERQPKLMQDLARPMIEARLAQVEAQDAARLAQIRELVAKGASVPQIGIALGLADGPWLRRIIRRACPDFVFGRGIKVGDGSMTQRRAQQLQQIRALVQDGADLERIAQVVKVANLRYLRRLVRAAVPDFAFGDSDRPQTIRRLAAEGATWRDIGAAIKVRDERHLRRCIRDVLPDFDFSRGKESPTAARDAEVARLYPTMSRGEVAARMGLTLSQVMNAIRRARDAGLLPAGPDRRAQAKVGDRVLDLHRQGLSIEAIAAETGLGLRAVGNRVRATGDAALGSKYKAARARAAELPGLVAQGMTAAQIAAHWGRKVSYVHSLACKLRIEMVRPQSDVAAARRELVRHLYAKGMTYREMSALLKVNASTLADDIKQLDLERRRPGRVKRAAEAPAEAERRAA